MPTNETTIRIYRSQTQATITVDDELRAIVHFDRRGIPTVTAKNEIDSTLDDETILTLVELG